MVNIQVQIILLQRYGRTILFVLEVDVFSLFCYICSSQQKTIINAMAVNEDGVMVTGGMNLEQSKILLGICLME